MSKRLQITLTYSKEKFNRAWENPQNQFEVRCWNSSWEQSDNQRSFAKNKTTDKATWKSNWKISHNFDLCKDKLSTRKWNDASTSRRVFTAKNCFQQICF